jgi:hypothetical protein
VDAAVAKPLSDNLARWSDAVRKAYQEGAIDDLISTRRLVAIAEGFVIFGDLKTAMTLGLSRFDEQTREAFFDFYNKLDSGNVPTDDAKSKTAKDANACPFA